MQTKRPLTEDALFDVAEIGGVAVGQVGGRHVEITFTVQAPDPAEASARAIRTATERLAGTVVAIEVMTTAEADRRASERPQLAGVAEVAEMLGVSKQRASALSKREDFPAPIERLSTGPVWRKGDLSTFALGWQRRPGRPRKPTQATSHAGD
ncbi:MAG TPA: hypothetical protein VGD45_20755 [Steroidobacter sp.]|uniref:hypothetical protein n=1 Tax=Steroidobacter sp. TaxID=1978227 RepID=UPI002EDA15EC